MTLQVDGNVDFKLVQKTCHLAVGFQPDIVELIKRFDKARTHFTLVVRTKRYTQHLKAGTLMDLKQFCYQISRRMPMKVCRQIGDADPLMPIDRSAPQWLWQ